MSEADAEAGARYYTTTSCPVCGGDVDGLNYRYACGLCGWVNQADDQPAEQADA